MAKAEQTPESGAKAAPPPSGSRGPATYLDMPADRRAAAEATATMLMATAQRVADALPLSADVDDFRRVLVAEAQA